MITSDRIYDNGNFIGNRVTLSPCPSFSNLVNTASRNHYLKILSKYQDEKGFFQFDTFWHLSINMRIMSFKNKQLFRLYQLKTIKAWINHFKDCRLCSYGRLSSLLLLCFTTIISAFQNFSSYLKIFYCRLRSIFQNYIPIIFCNQITSWPKS